MKQIFLLLITLFAASAYSRVSVLNPIISCTKPLEKCGYSTETLWDANGSLPIEKSLFDKLEKLAIEQTNIWSDTILEGDYISSGDTHVVNIEKVYKKQKHVAYRITYQELAWNTESCDYDEETEGAVKACPAGVIQESAFVSLKMDEVETDPKAFAEFYPEKD